MRGGRALAIQVSVLLLLVTISGIVVFRQPRTTASTGSVATSEGPSSLSASPTVSATASPSQPPTVQSTQAAQRNAVAVAAARTSTSTPTARISIPRINISDAPVYDRGTDAKGVMLIAPGYAVTRYASSAPFGGGNTVLYGHDDIQGNIFGHLYDLTAGDLIQLTVGGQTRVYRVTGHQIVAPTAISILAPTGDVRLTIITCWPFNVDTKRWIVSAVKV